MLGMRSLLVNESLRLELMDKGHVSAPWRWVTQWRGVLKGWEISQLHKYKRWYPLSAVAVIQELEINPEGQIRQHTKRIASENFHVWLSPLSSPPGFAASARNLWNHQINHFILTSSIVASRYHRGHTYSTPTTARGTADRVSIDEGDWCGQQHDNQRRQMLILLRIKFSFSNSPNT